MKLEKRDVAECLGLVYNGTRLRLNGEYYHTFNFHGGVFQTPAWNRIDVAWEEATDKVLEPLVELLKERL